MLAAQPMVSAGRGLPACFSGAFRATGSRHHRRPSPCSTTSHTSSPSSPRPLASPASSSSPDAAAARVDGIRVSQMRSTELLAKLVEAADPTGTARENVEGLTEEFFMASGTYLTLARKEGNTVVADRLERALQAAWAVKQSTMRPELQALNSLVRAETAAARKQVYMNGGDELADALVMNDRWFFTMLDRMTSDVERQPANLGKPDLLARLRAIKRETEAIAKQAVKQTGQQAEAE